MKSILLFAILLCCISLRAQTSAPPPWEFGAQFSHFILYFL